MLQLSSSFGILGLFSCYLQLHLASVGQYITQHEHFGDVWKKIREKKRTEVERLDLPILVQWKWEEKTKSYVVIFHFYDDFSKTNLRLKKRKLLSVAPFDRQFLSFSIDTRLKSSPDSRIAEKSIMTWAPSHIELALLSDLLHYANLIGGLPETVRRDLRYDLEITVVEDGMEDHQFELDEKQFDEIDKRLRNPSVFLGFDSNIKGKGTTYFCLELCPEYLDYLKEILKPYL